MVWIKFDESDTSTYPSPNMRVLAVINPDQIIVAKWVGEKTLECHNDYCGDDAVYDELTDTYYCRSGWYEANMYDEVDWYVNNPVTHWQPLPLLPEYHANKFK